MKIVNLSLCTIVLLALGAHTSPIEIHKYLLDKNEISEADLVYAGVDISIEGNFANSKDAILNITQELQNAFEKLAANPDIPTLLDKLKQLLNINHTQNATISNEITP